MARWFNEGDRVVKDHRRVHVYGVGGTMPFSAVPEGTAIGTVLGPSNEPETYYLVQFAPVPEPPTECTHEELVKVSGIPEPQPAPEQPEAEPSPA